MNVLLWKLVNFSCKGRVLLGDLILFEKRHHVRADPQSKDPLPEYGSPFDHKTKRTKETKIQFWQFPLNISNARTVHKLQGRSIDNLVVSSFFIDTHIVLCCAGKSEGNQRVASYVRIE